MKVLNSEGRVFGCLSADEQQELKDAAKMPGAKVDGMPIFGGWKACIDPSWNLGCAFRVTLPDAPVTCPVCPVCGKALKLHVWDDQCRVEYRCHACCYSQPDSEQRPKMPDKKEDGFRYELRQCGSSKWWWIAVPDAPVLTCPKCGGNLSKDSGTGEWVCFSALDHVGTTCQYSQPDSDQRPKRPEPVVGFMIEGVPATARECAAFIHGVQSAEEAAKQPAPAVKVIEPLDLMAGTLERTEKINEIVAWINATDHVRDRSKAEGT
jgi:predicted RNA-binding Zn-ribbon protein involved in translation (DUF1610 family)